MSKFKIKQNTFDPETIFSGALTKMKKKDIEDKGKVFDVIDFGEEMLEATFFPSQKIILKFFYAGTRYNEDLRITDEDIEIIKSWSIPQNWLLEGENSKLKKYKKNIDNFAKNPSMNYFRDLILILGRRSGKSWLSALIMTYEAYKLIGIYDPTKAFNVDNQIYIINTASSGDQARSEVFSQMRKFIARCPIFDGRIYQESSPNTKTPPKIVLLTDADIERNNKLEEAGTNPLPGSVVIQCGNSNSAALRGHSASAVIFDEIAHYVDTNGKSSGNAVYQALSPSVSNLYQFGEGRNIIISSPDKPSGFFYDFFQTAKSEESYLVFQLPTWDANPGYTKEMLEPELKNDKDGRASAEYGAVFRKNAGDNFFPYDLVTKAMNKIDGNYKKEEGLSYINYYMHIDPSRNSDRWAILIAHKERKLDKDLGRYVNFIVEDYSVAIEPVENKYIDPDDVIDNYVLKLANKFKLVSITSDQFFSLEQRKKLLNNKIFYKEISFNGTNKNKLYETTRDFFMKEDIALCNDDKQLEGELKNITIDYSKNPPRINKNTNDTKYPNDDLVDCLCGVVNAMSTGDSGQNRLPKSQLVRTGRI